MNRPLALPTGSHLSYQTPFLPNSKPKGGSTLHKNSFALTQLAEIVKMTAKEYQKSSRFSLRVLPWLPTMP